MGTFRVEVTAVGGHGCKRDAKEGERVYGCRRLDCPDCITVEYVEKLKRSGSSLDSATITHWPGQPDQVVDRITVNGHGNAEVVRGPGDFFTRIDVGDHVQLKSGGPPMHVDTVGTRIKCSWLDYGGAMNHADFERATLRKMKPEDVKVEPARPEPVEGGGEIPALREDPDPLLKANAEGHIGDGHRAE